MAPDKIADVGAVNCPQCGVTTQFEPERERGFCRSCGTQILPSRSTAVDPHDGAVAEAVEAVGDQVSSVGAARAAEPPSPVDREAESAAVGANGATRGGLRLRQATAWLLVLTAVGLGVAAHLLTAESPQAIEECNRNPAYCYEHERAIEAYFILAGPPALLAAFAFWRARVYATKGLAPASLAGLRLRQAIAWLIALLAGLLSFAVFIDNVSSADEILIGPALALAALTFWRARVYRARYRAAETRNAANAAGTSGSPEGSSGAPATLTGLRLRQATASFGALVASVLFYALANNGAPAHAYLIIPGPLFALSALGFARAHVYRRRYLVSESANAANGAGAARISQGSAKGFSAAMRLPPFAALVPSVLGLFAALLSLLLLILALTMLWEGNADKATDANGDTTWGAGSPQQGVGDPRVGSASAPAQGSSSGSGAASSGSTSGSTAASTSRGDAFPISAGAGVHAPKLAPGDLWERETPSSGAAGQQRAHTRTVVQARESADVEGSRYDALRFATFTNVTFTGSDHKTSVQSTEWKRASDLAVLKINAYTRMTLGEPDSPGEAPPGQDFSTEVVADPPCMYHDFPLSVDKTWTRTCTMYTKMPDGSRRSSSHATSYRVLRAERVEVPAGSFDAYVIEGRSREGTEDRYTLSWYSPLACGEVQTASAARGPSGELEVRDIATQLTAYKCAAGVGRL